MVSTARQLTAYRFAVHEIEKRWHIKGAHYMKDRAHPERYLARMRYFLDSLGAPDKTLSFIHITGTSGKGSTAIMLLEMLRETGKTTGLFTSPFSVSSIEKIQVNDRYIAPGAFVRIYKKLKPYIQEAEERGPWGGPSYFEIFLAIALIYFKEKKCDYVILEVGCGGTYDATNVIHPPRATIITNIGFDHMQILGNTLTKIAHNKAGIIKKGSALFTTEKRTQLRTLFKRICHERGATYHLVIPKKNSFSPGLLGAHQRENAALAATVARYLKIPEHAIFRGIERGRLPCRLEIMPGQPLTVLDGAHNVEKMKATAEAVQTFSKNHLMLIIAVSKDKNVKGMLKIIAPLADTIICSDFRVLVKDSYPAQTLARLARRCAKQGTPVRVVHGASQALRQAQKIAKVGDMILATGSFYFVGELRKHWFPESFILKNRRSF